MNIFANKHIICRRVWQEADGRRAPEAIGFRRPVSSAAVYFALRKDGPEQGEDQTSRRTRTALIVLPLLESSKASLIWSKE